MTPRNFKFKAYDSTSKEIRSVKSIIWIGDEIKEIGFDDGFGKPFSDKLILLQPIQQTDDAGKQIYQGHILRLTRVDLKIEGQPTKDLINLIEIYWDERHQQMRYNVYDENRCFSSGEVGRGCFIDGRAKQCKVEIIGNVFQNPDLLPKGK